MLGANAYRLLLLTVALMHIALLPLAAVLLGASFSRRLPRSPQGGCTAISQRGRRGSPVHSCRGGSAVLSVRRAPFFFPTGREG